MKRPSRRRTERLVNKILGLNGHHQAARIVARLEARLMLRPMIEILAKLPDETVAGRARLLGITRQAYYDWVNEKTRPNTVQAAKLAELTGFTVEEIRGRTGRR